MTDRIGKIRWKEGIRELMKRSYVKPWEGVSQWLKNSPVAYESVPPSEWSRFKKSDTLFVIGSGPSVERLTPNYWDFIRQHDSFGINYSFMNGIPTTYHYFSYEPRSAYADAREVLREVLTPELRRSLSKTLWFLSSKAMFRLVHPRIVPECFPDNPSIGIFHLPNAITLDSDRPFRSSDFQTSHSYRGTIGVVMTLIDRLNYKNIVLLGIDPQTSEHFTLKYPAMANARTKYYEKFDPKQPYQGMKPIGKRYRTIDEYFYAVRELYLEPKGVHLYMGVPNPMLSPRIPLYPQGANLL